MRAGWIIGEGDFVVVEGPLLDMSQITFFPFVRALHQ